MQLTKITPLVLEDLLLERLGISVDNKKSFLEPEYKLGDLWQFKDMKKAVARLYDAVVGGEYIGIYADYDCDGIPGATILTDLFKKLGILDRVHIYIPDRHDEGYGISKLGIDVLEEKKVTLMISVDVGITAIAEIADAQSRNIDVILTDHHACLRKASSEKLEIPAAYAVIHPQNGNYQNQEPCGASVAFYLVCAFLEKHRTEFEISEGWEKWMLDLVGFATLSDMVPLTRENRMLALYGLHVMRKTKRIGIQTLLEKNSISLHSLIESDLTFTVAPRLNAASRMATPMLAYNLLSTEDKLVAQQIVKDLDLINSERKSLVAQIVKSAHSNIEKRIITSELQEIVVIGNPEWRPAVLGLVANKLQEKYGKSFFVWGEGGDGSIKGSCRMNPEHHAALLFQALPGDLMIHAGGHQAAGGFSISKEKIHFLEDALNEVVSKINHVSKTNSDENHILIDLACANPMYVNTIRKFAPFGVGNPEPYFLFNEVVVDSVKKFGKNKEHIEIVISDGVNKATAFDFFVDDNLIQKLVPSSKIKLVGTLETGWRGGVRIRIKDAISYNI